MYIMQKKRRGTLEFGIPHAPLLVKPINKVKSDFYDEKKNLISAKIPIYTWKEVQRFRQGGTQQASQDGIIRRLQEQGYHSCAAEINVIMNLDKSINSRNQMGKYGIKTAVLRLVQRPSALKLLTDTLQTCEDLIHAGATIQAIHSRKDVAITFIDMKDYWLAQYILESSLQLMDEYNIDSSHHHKVLAEIHILLAYVKGQWSRRGYADHSVDDRISHVTACRQLVGKELWRMKSDIIKLALKQPRSTGDFRQDITVIDSRTSSLRQIASVLEITLLIEKSCEMLYRAKVPSEESVNLALYYTKEALRRSREILDVDTLKISLIRSGIISTDCGNFTEAIDSYRLLIYTDNNNKDRRARAIGYQGIGECLRRKKDVAGALDTLLTSCEVGASVIDIRIEALVQMGNILLEEGMLIEAEECIHAAFAELQKDNTIDGSRDSPTLQSQWMQYLWVIFGVAKGESCWSRYGSLTRKATPNAIRALCEFKTRRAPMPLLRFHAATPVTPITEVFDESQLVKPIAIHVQCNILKMGTKELSFKAETSMDYRADAPSTSSLSKDRNVSSDQKQSLRPASKIMSEKSLSFKEKFPEYTTFCDLSSTTDSTSSSAGSANIFDREVLYQSDLGQTANLADVKSSVMSSSGSGSKSTTKSGTITSDSGKLISTSSDSNSLERFSKWQMRSVTNVRIQG